MRAQVVAARACSAQVGGNIGNNLDNFRLWGKSCQDKKRRGDGVY